MRAHHLTIAYTGRHRDDTPDGQHLAAAREAVAVLGRTSRPTARHADRELAAAMARHPAGKGRLG